MIEFLHEYWTPLLWTDGYRFTGGASTLWLLILSVVIGGVLALFLAIGRVSSNKYIQFPIWLFTYIFRGTPLYFSRYAAVCSVAGVLFRHVHAGDC